MNPLPSRASSGACDGKAEEEGQALPPSTDDNAASVRCREARSRQRGLPTHPGTVHDLTAAADPVTAFGLAHARGELVAVRTAGSTVAARRVLRSTDSWVSSFEAVSSLSGIAAGSQVWVPGPLSSSMNLFAAVHADHVGAAVLTGLRPLARATHAVLTPWQLVRLLGDEPRPGLVVVVAGDALSPALAARASAAGFAVHHYYGAAELSFVAWGADGSSLRAFPGVALDVRGGEVWVRSPYLCHGYDGPVGPLRRDQDGWATVGDRGVLTDGVLHLHGRPGVVTTGGATVDVAEVEAALRGPARGEVVALGVPHPDLGEVLVAVLTDGGDRGPLVDVARTGLDAAARPRRWYHADLLPLTTAGKVDRTALASAVEAGRLRRLDGSTVVS